MRITVESHKNPPSSWVFAIHIASSQFCTACYIVTLIPFFSLKLWKCSFFCLSLVYQLWAIKLCITIYLNGKLWPGEKSIWHKFNCNDVTLIIFGMIFADWNMGPCKWPEHDWKSEGKDVEHHRLTHQQDTICVYNTGKYSNMFWKSIFLKLSPLYKTQHLKKFK